MCIKDACMCKTITLDQVCVYSHVTAPAKVCIAIYYVHVYSIQNYDSVWIAHACMQPRSYICMFLSDHFGEWFFKNIPKVVVSLRVLINDAVLAILLAHTLCFPSKHQRETLLSNQVNANSNPL